MTTRQSLSPIDIQSAVFKRVFRGADPEEVRLFLESVAESHQALIMERGQLAQSVEYLQASLDEFRRRENLLKDALYTAQKTAEDIKTLAQREAQSIVQEAAVRAEAVIQQAQLRSHEMERSLLDVRLEKENTLGSLREIVMRTQNVIDLLGQKSETENVTTFYKEKDA